MVEYLILNEKVLLVKQLIFLSRKGSYITNLQRYKKKSGSSYVKMLNNVSAAHFTLNCAIMRLSHRRTHGVRTIVCIAVEQIPES